MVTAGIVSIDEQIASMADMYPMLKVVERTANAALWRGPLKPLFMTFVVEIAYRVPPIIESIDARRQQPRVSVISPVLRPRQNSAEGALPHVYWDGDRPVLCLFDPDGSEWTPFDRLIDTTAKWVIDWLVCYEGWRATGEWTGGGRHVSSQDERVRS
jgi:hypothetical protein